LRIPHAVGRTDRPVRRVNAIESRVAGPNRDGAARAELRAADARLAPSMDLTILLVTRDRPVLLAHSIRSILASAAAAEPDIVTQVLVVDDSEDGSAGPVAASLDIPYERNPIRGARKGPDAARAWAIPQIRTDLVALFDDDDLMLEDHIPRLARQICHGADVCSTGFWYADPDPADVTKLVARRRHLPRQPRLGDLLAGYQPVNDQAMMRTPVAQSVEWDPARETLMTYHVWIQLLLADRRFVVNRSATFLYRQHAASLSHNLDARQPALRAQLLAESRALAVEKYGRVPGPSIPVRLGLARFALGKAIRGT
jgi:glycosyltransferase involved in cell wall biosynthesis